MNRVVRITRRELRLQLRSKGFLISAIASALLIVAFVVIPTLLDTDSEYRVDVVDNPSLAEALDEQADAANVEVAIQAAAEEDARQAVTDGDTDAAVLGDSTLLTEGTPDDELATLIDGAHETVTVEAQLAESNLPVEQVVEAVTVAPLEHEMIEDSSYEDARIMLSLVIMVALMFLLMTTTLNVAGGVIEEKGSRIVEILLVAVTARQLLTGKLLAFGLIGLVQLLIFSTAGVTAAISVGLTDNLPPGWPWIIAATFGGYVLGFLFFGAMAAALASLTSRQEELSSTTAPLTAMTVMSYFGAFFAFTDPGSVLANTVAIVPPFSSMALPVSLAAGDVSGWMVALSLALMAVAIVVIMLIAATIYERSVLRTGSRIKLRQALSSADDVSDDPDDDADGEQPLAMAGSTK